MVEVEATSQAVADEAEVETGVPCGGCFPLQVFVVSVRNVLVSLAECGIERLCACGLLVGSEVSIVTDTFLLAGHTPTQTELHLGDSLHVFQESLLVDFPTESYRWEVTPLVTLVEA